MSDPAEREPDAGRTFVVTQQQLLELLGHDGARAFAEAAAESKARTAAHPGEREEIRIVYQNGKVIEVCGAPRRWKTLRRP